MLEIFSGLSLGLLIGFLVGAWQSHKELAKITAANAELIKFLMAKQDPGAFITAFPSPDMDKEKREEENKNRKTQSEYNSIYLRDSVTHGITENEMKRFGLEEPEEVNA